MKQTLKMSLYIGICEFVSFQTRENQQCSVLRDYEKNCKISGGSLKITKIYSLILWYSLFYDTVYSRANSTNSSHHFLI